MNKRVILYAAFGACCLLLWQTWQADHRPVEMPKAALTTAQAGSGANMAPNLPVHSTSATPLEHDTPVNTKRLVSVQTDVLDVAIDLQGGDLVSAKLLAYPAQKGHKQVVQLLNDHGESFYVAQSGLIGAGGVSDLKYTSQQKHYRMRDQDHQTEVTLTAKTKSGLEIQKTYTFTRGKYAVDLRYQVHNAGKTDWGGRFYQQLSQRKPIEKKKGMFGFRTYDGAAYSTPESPYEKVTYDDMQDENLNKQAIGRAWVAIQQHYFLSAWAPSSSVNSQHIYSRFRDGVYTIGVIGPDIQLSPNQAMTHKAKLYVGPEITQNLEAVAPKLKLTIDYGMLWMLSVSIFWLMQKIFAVVGNWGWSIILVTVLIKIIFYKLSESSYRSMAKMRALQPRLEALKAQYGDDRQAIGAATMSLYKQEKVNPLGGCLPFLIQIPFFFALYYVLIESVQMRHAPFVLWITDLSAKDPFYVLPILMGGSMVLQQLISPKPADPMQAKMMLVLPIVFTVTFLNFPAGLVLYWLVNNVLSVLQQWLITKRVETEAQRGRR